MKLLLFVLCFLPIISFSQSVDTYATDDKGYVEIAIKPTVKKGFKVMIRGKDFRFEYIKDSDGKDRQFITFSAIFDYMEGYGYDFITTIEAPDYMKPIETYYLWRRRF